MPNICVASDTTGISTKPTRDPYEISLFPPLSLRFRRGEGRIRDGGPLNHFLRENWNFRHRKSGMRSRHGSSSFLVFLRDSSERGCLPPAAMKTRKMSLGIVAITAINTRVTSKGIEKGKRISTRKLHPTLLTLLKLKGNFVLTQNTQLLLFSLFLFAIGDVRHFKEGLHVKLIISCIISREIDRRRQMRIVWRARSPTKRNNVSLENPFALAITRARRS